MIFPNQLIRSSKPTGSVPVRLTLMVLIVIFGLTSAHATSLPGEAANRAALSNCVGRNLKPEDNGTVIGMLMLVLADAEPPESSLHELFAPKRDEIMNNVASLMARLSEQDCRREMMAISPKKTGDRFLVVLDQIMTRSGAALQKAGERVGQAFAVDLIKRLDPKVAGDLLGSAGDGSTNSSSRPTPTPGSP